jgi:hypothetical protein
VTTAVHPDAVHPDAVHPDAVHPDAVPGTRRATSVLWWLVPLVVAVALIGTVALIAARDTGVPTPPARYVVPRGTGAAMDAGQHLAVLPATITMRQGVEIVIVNEDDRAFDLGPFVIGPGQTFRKVMTEKGTFRNTCRLAPGGDVTFVVF